MPGYYRRSQPDCFCYRLRYEKARAELPEKALVSIESYGTLWYVIMGLVGIFKGVPFLANKLAGVNVGEQGTLFQEGLSC